MAAGETNIGGIVGFLRLEAGQFHKEIQQALLEIEALDNKDVRVSVKTDGGAGLEKLPAQIRSASSAMDGLKASSQRLEDATARVGIAQARLNELQVSGKASASQLMSAQLAVTKAHRDEEAALEGVKRAEQDAAYASYESNVSQAKSVDSTKKLSKARQELEGATKRTESAQRRLDKANDSGSFLRKITSEFAYIRALKGEKDATDEVGKSAEKSRGSSGLLIGSIITLAPAIVPIAAAAVGLAAGFTGMAVAGILAFKGIKDAMSANNAVGEAYQAGLGELRTDMEALGAVAASGLLAPFQQAVEDVTVQMGALTESTTFLTTVTGNAAQHLEHGLMSAFIALQPLIQDAAMYIGELMAKFDTLMSGPGVVAFGDYVRSVLPQVMDAIESLAGAVGHVVEAFAPIGTGVVSAIKVFSDMISRIPVDVLTAILQLGTSIWVGFKLFATLSTPIAALSAALGGVEAMSARAATGLRILSMSAGIVSAVVAGLLIVFTATAGAQREIQAGTDSLTDALIRSNGAIDDNVRLSALKIAQDNGMLENARKLGIGTNQVVDAVLGQANAMGDLDKARDKALAKQKALVDAGQADASTVSDVQVAYLNLKNQLRDAGIQWDGTKVKVQEHNDVVGAAKGVVDNANDAWDRAATKLGTTGTALQNAATDQQKMAEQTATATTKMQEQNNAAGLLKQALDELNGKALSDSEAQDAYAHSKNTLGDQTKSAQEKLAAAEKAKDNLSDGHTAKGGAASVSKAKGNLNYALERLNILQKSGKATALQLAAAHHAVQVAQDRLATATGKANTVTGAATKAQRDAADAAIEAAKKEVEASKTVEGNSEQALANREKIRDAIAKGNAAAGTSGDLAKTNKDAREKLIKVREEVIKTAASWGWNAEKVRAYLDKVDQVPDYIKPTTFQAETAPAIKKTQEWVGVIDGVPTWREIAYKADPSEGEVRTKVWVGVIDGVPTWRLVTMSAETAAAMKALATLQGAIAGVHDKTVTISAVYAQYGQQAALTAHNNETLDRHGQRTDANGHIYSDGVTKMAEGGFPGRQSTIMRSTKPILWNEAPGGEAYISLAPQKRARSLAIHEEVGRLIGAGGGGGSSRMHPDDIKAIGKELALAVRQAPRPRVDLDEFNRRLA